MLDKLTGAYMSV